MSELTLLQPSESSNEEIAGIIISFVSGSSYDNLFSQVKQKSFEGSTVLTYKATEFDSGNILQAMQGNFTNLNEGMRRFAGFVEKLTYKCPGCIVFNWECSSGFSGEEFNEAINLWKLLELIIKRGHMAMFSDFSLKALINKWNVEILGLNPFIKVGETSKSINLSFSKDKLLNCPSAQLQTVARMSSENSIKVNVLGGTIMYGVDSRVKDTDKYDIEVLTVASNFPAPQSYLESEIEDHKGLAGHVLLTYKEGGIILTSMGHWIELLKIETTKERLFEETERIYGSSEAEKVKKEYYSLDEEDQIRYLSSNSKKYVHEQTPGSNMMLSKNKIEEL